MRRLVLVVCIWGVLVGGFALYLGNDDGGRVAPPPPVARAPSAGGSIDIEVRASFTAEPDPFALQMDGDGPPVSLRVAVNGSEVLERTSVVDGSTPLMASDVDEFVQGANEIFVSAAPPLASSGGGHHALRILVTSDRGPLADRTFWSEGGAPIATAFSLFIGKEEAHDH